MKFITMGAMVLLAWTMPVRAVDVGDITSFIYSNASMRIKEIKNTTDNGRLINIRVERLSSPLDGGTTIPMESHDEILMTPASLLLPAKSSDVIRFYYNGPKDSLERYYRIVWSDRALTDSQSGVATRSAVATTSARIGTILVVSPRLAKYDYTYLNGTMKNKGNTTLRIISYGPCLKPEKNKKECRENYFLMPGRERTFSQVDVADVKGRVALWQAEQFVSVK